VLVRDGIELYRGMAQTYTDDTTILPYRSYTYVLTACTVAGCISSTSVSLNNRLMTEKYINNVNLA